MHPLHIPCRVVPYMISLSMAKNYWPVTLALCGGNLLLSHLLEPLNLSVEERNGSRVLWFGPWMAPGALPWVAGGHCASPPGSHRRQRTRGLLREPPAVADLKKLEEIFSSRSTVGNTTGTSPRNTTGTSPRNTTGTSPKITIGNTTGTSPRITIGNTTGTSRKLL